MKRRDALKVIAASTLGTAGLGLTGRDRARADQPDGSPGNLLELTVAGYEYDRIAPLARGQVGIEGCAHQFQPDRIGPLNSHLFSGPRTRDVSEVGLHPFMLAYANEGFRDYTLLPIFPLRTFRHKSIFIRTDRGIDRPEDLRGRRIATPGFSSSSLTWIRGMLQDEYGIAPTDIEWFVSDVDSSAATSWGASLLENILPEGLKITSGPPGKDESEMLADGDVDALFHAVEPKIFVEGDERVTRLFPDFRTEEQSYFEKTGIFPIMHAVAVRRRLVEDHPWLPRALFEAYSESKRSALEEIRKLGWAFNSLPWLAQEVEDTRKLMGDNWWPYGIEPNRKTLESLFRYSHDQGLAKSRLRIEDLFHPSTLGFTEG